MDRITRLADYARTVGKLRTSIELRHVVIRNSIPGSAAQVIQRMELADTLHRKGACRRAHREAAAAMTEWQTGGNHRTASALSSVLLVNRLRLLDGCGDTGGARTLLDDHQALLPPRGHPDWELVAALTLTTVGEYAHTTARRLLCKAASWSRFRPRLHQQQPHTAVRQLILDTLGYRHEIDRPLIDTWLVQREADAVRCRPKHEVPVIEVWLDDDL